jgi:uncharacterized protein (DUF433 family)
MNYQDIVTVKEGKRGGRPCIRGLRITVNDALRWLAAGVSNAQILADFPELTEGAIRACLAYAEGFHPAKSSTSNRPLSALTVP